MKHIIKNGKRSHLRGGESGETFLVEYRKKKFVLRNYETKDEADYIMNIYKKLRRYGFLPEIYVQDGKSLLIEYVEGRDCTKRDTSKVALQVGRICGLINHLKMKGIRLKERSMSSIFKTLREYRIIDEKSYHILQSRYTLLRKKIHPTLAIDFDDVYPKNFRLRNGRVFLVDLEDFDMKVKGSCIGKAFLRWFKKPAQREKFLKGYGSIASIDFLTEDYLQFLYLNFTLYIVAYKLKYNKEINPNDLRRLRILSWGKEINE